MPRIKDVPNRHGSGIPPLYDGTLGTLPSPSPIHKVIGGLTTHTNSMLYDPQLVQPMRDEVTRLGVKELLTPTDVEQAFGKGGTLLVFVNSVCGCAAAGARPGLALSLMNEKKPDSVVTVFAGMEREAVARAREYFKPYQPSSPQIALIKGSEVLKMWQRHDIESKDPSGLAQSLSSAYDEFC